MKEFAIDAIKKIRALDEKGDASVRDFHVPKVNFEADSLFNLVDWSGVEEELHEPVHTCFIPTGHLSQFLTKPFPMISADYHTQSCERAVKQSRGT